jgi:pre-mRNA-processing factor 6
MLWVLVSKLEEFDGKSIKAHALLEMGRLGNPANEVLWAESIGVEERSGDRLDDRYVFLFIPLL